MAHAIISKFMIGTDEGLNTVRSISAAIAREKYSGKVPEDQLTAYIEHNFNDDVLHVEMNSMSNQYLVVYADGEPAGYARITSKGKRPEIFGKKTVMRIADFGILNKFDDVQIKKSLFEKCLAVCKMQQIVWMSEYTEDADVVFFESYGFKKSTDINDQHEFDLKPIYLIYDKEPNNN